MLEVECGGERELGNAGMPGLGDEGGDGGISNDQQGMSNDRGENEPRTANLQPVTCNLQPATCSFEPKTTNDEPRTTNTPPYHWHTIRTPYFGWFPWDKVRGGWRLRLLDFKWFEWAAARWVLKHEKEFDVVQVCELPFFVNYYKSMGGRLPVVVRITAPNYSDPVGGVEKADAVIASGMSIEFVKQNGRMDVVNIPNSIDPDVFYPAQSTFREKHGISSERVMFLYVARFQGFKNHPLLIAAFEQYKANGGEGLLILAGSGPHEQSVKKLVAEKNLMDDVLFLGEVGYSELPDIYNASDIQVISSDYESFCFSAIESMACAKPVITTDNGWVPVLLAKREEDEDGVSHRSPAGRRRKTVDLLGKTKDHRPQTLEGGLVVPCGDAKVLSNAMYSLSNDNASRMRMGQRNVDYVSIHYCWRKNAGALLDLYVRLRSHAV
ncbi:MAG: glycosyltransferase family 4 protein [Kiritimatiellae bacterium]|nr:glycosyltransferase family 4 protein [Kiritimatiellia bacterium]